MTTYAITGATGYLGSRLTRHLRSAGARVIALSRSPRAEDPDAAAFSLDHHGPVARLEEADVLVHCAYDFSLRTRAEIDEQNVRGSIRLFDAAKNAGVTRVVLISTISAFPGCQSLYGQAKLAIETAVRQRGGAVVRPGLIFGPQPGGMMGTLAHAAASSAILPVPAGGLQNLYLAHEDDVAATVQRVAEYAGDAPNPVTAAASRPWRLPALFRALGAAVGRTPVVVPVPWQLMWAGIRAVELTGLPSPLRSDSVVSLVNQNPLPSFAEVAALGVSFRDFTPDVVMSARP